MINTAQYISFSEEDTAILAGKVAQKAAKGDVFALYGTLGMGKSVFARAFIQSLVGKVEVPSPTFTLLQTYEAPHFDIYHFDLYRIKKAEEVFELGIEEAFYEGVSLIEWPERMEQYLPSKTIKIEIKDEGRGREFVFSCQDEKNAKRFLGLNEA